MHKEIDFFTHLIDTPLVELINRANTLRKEHSGDTFEFCSIVNAKNGKCSEDCKYCAQSSHYNTDISEFPLISEEELILSADEAVASLSSRHSIVTSGHGPSINDIDVIEKAVIKIKKKYPDLKICASLGILDDTSLLRLKNAGVSRYHHNVETSSDYYGEIVSTHTYKNRVDTINHAKEMGFEICSGGILGMGETWEDRISMALEIRDLQINSIPLNFLMPIEGTPLSSVTKLTQEELIRIVAIFKIINPNKDIKIIAGREEYLKDSQVLAFMAGASGMMIGGYLTVDGRTPDDDHNLLKNIQQLWAKS